MKNDEDAVRAVEEMMGAIQYLHEKIDRLEAAMMHMIKIFEKAARKIGL